MPLYSDVAQAESVPRRSAPMKNARMKLRKDSMAVFDVEDLWVMIVLPHKKRVVQSKQKVRYPSRLLFGKMEPKESGFMD